MPTIKKSTDKKSAKPRTTTKNFMSEFDEEDVAVIPEEESEEEGLGVPEVASLEGEDVGILPVAGAPKSSGKQFEMVPITLFETIDPAPIVGTYDFRREMGISRLVKGKYVLPRHVAEVLVDVGAATM